MKNKLTLHLRKGWAGAQRIIHQILLILDILAILIQTYSPLPLGEGQCEGIMKGWTMKPARIIPGGMDAPSTSRVHTGLTNL